MKLLSNKELVCINGGGPILDIWEDLKYLVTEGIPDFCRGFVAGWNS